MHDFIRIGTDVFEVCCHNAGLRERERERGGREREGEGECF